MLTFVPADRLPWQGMFDVLRPAIAAGNQSEADVKSKLQSGEYAAFRASDEADGWLISATGNGTFYLVYAAGRSLTGPEAFRRMIRDLETIAKQQGCTSMRIEGRRGWERVLPDYSVTDRSGGVSTLVKVI